MTAWIRTTEALAALADSLRGAPAIALDSESDSLHHHREKVCLVQLAAADGREVLIDPLAGANLSALGPVLADPLITKVLHGADYDVTTMRRDFGVTFSSVFDTMVAARFLGLPAVGLQALVRNELGVELSKASQKDDWSRRPLTPTQEGYALSDVRHLLRLFDLLVARLVDIGRLSWVREECDAVAALEPARRQRDPEAWLRVKGVRRLARRQQGVVRAACAWREAAAEATDIPAFKIIGTDGLLALGTRQPKTVAEIVAIRGGLSPRFHDRARGLADAIAEAVALPEDALPRVDPPPRPPIVPDAVRRRIERLRKWRPAEAKRLSLDVAIVLPQRLLDKVAERGPGDLAALSEVPGIRQWRVSALGEGILAAVRE